MYNFSSTDLDRVLDGNFTNAYITRAITWDYLVFSLQPVLMLDNVPLVDDIALVSRDSRYVYNGKEISTEFFYVFRPLNHSKDGKKWDNINQGFIGYDTPLYMPGSIYGLKYVASEMGKIISKDFIKEIDRIEVWKNLSGGAAVLSILTLITGEVFTAGMLADPVSMYTNKDRGVTTLLGVTAGAWLCYAASYALIGLCDNFIADKYQEVIHILSKGNKTFSTNQERLNIDCFRGLDVYAVMPVPENPFMKSNYTGMFGAGLGVHIPVLYFDIMALNLYAKYSYIGFNNTMRYKPASFKQASAVIHYFHSGIDLDVKIIRFLLEFRNYSICGRMLLRKIKRLVLLN